MNATILTSATVLDGVRPAVRGCSVVLEGERIRSVGTDPVQPGPDDRVIDLGGRTIMPGMATCHFHSTYRDIGTAPYGYEYPPAYQALICHHNLMTAVRHGYTTVVGAGGARDIEPALKMAIEDGFVPGPRFKPSGRELSTTGHANEMMTPWHWNLPEMGAARSINGADAFRFAVRDEIKRGVEVIKLFVTGGHGVAGSKDRMEMTRDEFAAAIDAAHSRGAMARGHVVGKGPIMLAIELGIDLIDHCDGMDDEVIAALVETNTFVVPSIHYQKVIARRQEARKPGASAAVLQAFEHMCGMLPKAEAAGVKLLLGDDFGGPGMDHGEYGQELHTYVEDAGLSPLTVIKWATYNAAALLEREDDLGTVEAGKLADLLIIDGDPSADIGALADKLPTAVLKGGEVIVGALQA
jgi:imidazolonepropionase-like amidohydrolase